MASTTAALMLLAALAFASPPGPPAWQCGKLTDYYAKVTTECAAPDCNAAQRNLGGDLLVLHYQSYGGPQCQGCNPSIPSTCCQACKDTDGCNAWVLCTNKDGCGSGCAAYAKQFKVPLSYSDKLPHKFWGNWGGCQGDKWPFGMCSLKVVDAKNPQVTGTNAADGWVSGIVPKTAADPKCPATLSAKSCKACLSTKNPAMCFSCIKDVNTLEAPAQCVTCASLASKTAQEACIKCAAGTGGSDCKQCLDADCSDADCMNARMSNPTKAPNLGSVDQCFNCQAAAASGGATKVAACSRCFEAYTVPKQNRGACLDCISSSGAAAAAGCPGCHGANVGDKAKCLACVKQAKTAADSNGCGACSDKNNVPVAFAAACQQCVLTAQDDGAKGYCSNLDRDTTMAAVTSFYKCLAGTKGGDAPGNNCWQCYRVGDVAAAGKCYECLGKVSGGNGIHCTHCWEPSNMATKVGGETKAAKCEKCVIDKDKAKGNAGECW